ncbi:uncharacterized protein LOC134220379 [Armigeres subalbatus]|uniref:uncharacterized protein LOC134220379 n=1 Tax=Armigeres subalbatus TaxID=124917 RepID=UPI002ED01D59
MAEQPEYVIEGLRQVATGQGFTENLYRIEFESGSDKGDGFMGTLFKAFIREDGRDELMVLVKVLPEHETRKQQSIAMFHREVMAYNVVLPMFRQFQAEKGISVDDKQGFWRVPKCYYASCDLQKMESVVIMEDLREEDFRMWNKLRPVDFHHTRLLVEQLGMFHAISFAMKDQQPERFAHLKQLGDPMKVMIDMDPKKTINNLFEEMFERAVTVVEGENEKVKKTLNRLKGVITESYLACVDGEDAEPYTVVGHGDCWVNNMMYAYESEEPSPTDIRLIDWQLCRYVSPILDLSYFIYICTDEGLRAEHYDELLDVYYKSLSNFLKVLGGDVERQFPKDAFDAQWKKYGRFGLLMGLIVLPMICTERDELPDMEEYMDKVVNGEENVKYEYATSKKAADLYEKRISGTIRDVIRFGYL